MAKITQIKNGEGQQRTIDEINSRWEQDFVHVQILNLTIVVLRIEQKLLYEDYCFECPDVIWLDFEVKNLKQIARHLTSREEWEGAADEVLQRDVHRPAELLQADAKNEGHQKEIHGRSSHERIKVQDWAQMILYALILRIALYISTIYHHSSSFLEFVEHVQWG